MVVLAVAAMATMAVATVLEMHSDLVSGPMRRLAIIVAACLVDSDSIRPDDPEHALAGHFARGTMPRLLKP